MELTDLSLKVLPLSTLLNQFRKDSEGTRASEIVQDYFLRVWGGGGYDKTLVKVCNSFPVLKPDGEEVMHALNSLLHALEEKHPGAFIDLEG